MTNRSRTPTLCPVPIGDVERAMLLSRIERMQQLMDELEETVDAIGRARLRERLKREMRAAREAVKVLATAD